MIHRQDIGMRLYLRNVVHRREAKGFNAIHHTDNACYFLIITPFPLAHIVISKVYGAKSMGETGQILEQDVQYE